LGSGTRKSLKDFAEDDEEDWGDLMAQLSPKSKKSGRKDETEGEEEWEKSRRGGAIGGSRSAIRRPSDHTPAAAAKSRESSKRKRRSQSVTAKVDLTKKFGEADDGEDEDWGDLEAQLNKKSGVGTKSGKKDDDEDWDDLAKQLSPRGKDVKKVLRDFAEVDDDDDDDWADLGQQLGGGGKEKGKGKDKAAKTTSAAPKLGQYAEGDDDDDWGDLAKQLSPGRRRASSANPPRMQSSFLPSFSRQLVPSSLVTVVYVWHWGRGGEARGGRRRRRLGGHGGQRVGHAVAVVVLVALPSADRGRGGRRGRLRGPGGRGRRAGPRGQAGPHPQGPPAGGRVRPGHPQRRRGRRARGRPLRRRF
jgi:hypothetical protein